MPSQHLSTLRSLPAAALFAATLLGAATADPPAATSLQGQLLIAAPSLGDLRFAHTVVLMVRHDQEGALGIVINRPLGER